MNKLPVCPSCGKLSQSCVCCPECGNMIPENPRYEFPLKVGDIVKYKNELPDEKGMLYKISEVNGDRVLMECISFNYPIHPTYTAMMDDIEEMPETNFPLSHYPINL
jgi:hypothetical protein